jgi:nucleolar protein 56
MNAIIIESTFGLLAFDEENKLVDKELFPRKPDVAAKSLAKIEAGEATSEIVELINRLRKQGYDTFTLENAALAKQVQKQLGVSAEVEKSSAAGKLLRSETERFAVETGFARDADEFRLWLRNVTMEIARLRVRGAVEKRDLIVAQAIQTLDDLEKTINMLMIRVREWYGVHFPELDRLLEKHETYARLVLKLGNKDSFTVENLKKQDIQEAKAEGIAKVAEKSMGANLTETDLAQIQALCKDVLSLYDLRQGLEGYLDKIMEEVAPNMKTLVGSLLGARLIAVAGGLSNLARKPASTIQVLGAEKALFRSLKTGTRPPKHGMIFQHTLLHDAKRWQRGKIARALAGKLAIAARVDAFGGRNIGKDLATDLNKRIEEIQQKYAEPPPISAQPEKPRLEREKYRHEKGKRRKHRCER